MSDENWRDYFGDPYPSKAYVGEKSVNIKIPNNKIMHLVEALLKAFMTGREVDLAVYLEPKKRMTVTSRG
jgi:hypothetical protein